MVFAELTRGISQRLQQFRNRRILSLESHLGSWETNLSKASAEATLPRDERCASCSTTLLAVGICEHHALFGEAVDVWSSITHNSVAVTAKILNAYVISPNNEDIWLRCASFLRHADYPHSIGIRDTCNGGAGAGAVGEDHKLLRVE